MGVKRPIILEALLVTQMCLAKFIKKKKHVEETDGAVEQDRLNKTYITAGGDKDIK